MSENADAVFNLYFVSEGEVSLVFEHRGTFRSVVVAMKAAIERSPEAFVRLLSRAEAKVVDEGQDPYWHSTLTKNNQYVLEEATLDTSTGDP